MTTPANTAPLVIRTYNDLSQNNTYLLGSYDIPLPSNYVLATSNNGRLVPTPSPSVSSLTVGGQLISNQSQFSTLQVSTLSTGVLQATTATFGSGPVVCDSLTAGVTTFRGSIVNITDGSVVTLQSPYWGKYLFVSSPEHIQLTLVNAVDGALIHIKNVAVNSTTTVINVNDGPQFLGYLSTLRVMYNSTMSRWYRV